MAITNIGSLGSQSSKTSSTTVVITTTATAEINNLIVVTTVWDNTDTADGQTTRLTCTDSAGNTYTKIREQTETDGVAEDGITGAIFYTRATAQLASGGTITVTSNTARVAKCASAWEFGIGTAVGVAATQTQQLPSTQPPAISISGLPSREYLFLHLCAAERISTDGYTQDANYSNLTFTGTSTGAAATNVAFYGGFRILTSTGDTIDVALSAGAQHLQIYTALYEAGGGAQTVAVNQIAETDLSQAMIGYRVQYLRPTLDITDGGWTTDAGGSDLRTAIDETTASDADYIRSSISPVAADICEIKLSSGGNPFADNDGDSHHIRYRFKKDSAAGDSINLTVRLMQEAVEIVSWSHTDISSSFTTVEQHLTDAQANAITDYGDLRLRFEAIVA